jgi:hypothetical protein
MNSNYCTDLSPKTIRTLGEDQVEKFAVDMKVNQMLRARRDQILDAIGSRTVEPTPDLLAELSQLDDALGIEPLTFPETIDGLRAELKEEEKDLCRAQIRAELATETDEISCQCLAHSLALIDDPASPWNQE